MDCNCVIAGYEYVCMYVHECLYVYALDVCLCVTLCALPLSMCGEKEKVREREFLNGVGRKIPLKEGT